MADKPTSPPPAYFLSLSLENVRSFGAKQTVSFARPDGRPAQWTIILGDNGVGKTTVLKALACLMPWKEYKYNDVISWNPAFEQLMDKWWPVRSLREKTLTIDYEAHVGGFNEANKYLNSKTANMLAAIDIIGDEDLDEYGYSMAFASLPEALLGIRGYGYGAGRTIGNSTLRGSRENQSLCLGGGPFASRRSIK